MESIVVLLLLLLIYILLNISFYMASASASARVDKSIVYTLFFVLAFSSLLYLWYYKSGMIYMGLRPLISI